MLVGVTAGKDKTGGSSWRIYGGAPIITSRSLTAKLEPLLRRYFMEADRATVHDIHFTKLLGQHFG
jgi:hypothetical protein